MQSLLFFFSRGAERERASNKNGQDGVRSKGEEEGEEKLYSS